MNTNTNTQHAACPEHGDENLDSQVEGNKTYILCQVDGCPWFETVVEELENRTTPSAPSPFPSPLQSSSSFMD